MAHDKQHSLAKLINSKSRYPRDEDMTSSVKKIRLIGMDKCDIAYH